tara:strand:+ start:231 stop:428 length:198 start_codon:yes stop_codon:yes gene_type:complete
MIKIYMILLIGNMYILEPSPIEIQPSFSCGDYGDILREQKADYNEEQNRWILKDGRGDWFGVMCE